MSIVSACLFGALGGLLVELVSLGSVFTTWQAARREARTKGRIPPPLRDHFDLVADLLVLVTRAMLGAGVGLVLRHQISGPLAAIMLGAAAPSLLAQLGSWGWGLREPAEESSTIAEASEGAPGLKAP
jgi:hypothetical protein